MNIKEFGPGITIGKSYRTLNKVAQFIFWVPVMAYATYVVR